MRDDNAPPIRSLEWTPKVLHHELQRLLILCGLAPLDLIRGYDQGKDGSFSRKEVRIGPPPDS